MLASTRGNHVFLQPAAVRQNNGGAGTLLLHEFLHVLVEQQAGANAPLWLREGLVETLAAPEREVGAGRLPGGPGGRGVGPSLERHRFPPGA